MLPHEIFMCMYWRNEYAASHKIHFCKHNTFGDFLLLYNSDELGYSKKITGKLDILYCRGAHFKNNSTECDDTYFEQFFARISKMQILHFEGVCLIKKSRRLLL